MGFVTTFQPPQWQWGTFSGIVLVLDDHPNWHCDNKLFHKVLQSKLLSAAGLAMFVVKNQRLDGGEGEEVKKRLLPPLERLSVHGEV